MGNKNVKRSQARAFAGPSAKAGKSRDMHESCLVDIKKKKEKQLGNEARAPDVFGRDVLTGPSHAVT